MLAEVRSLVRQVERHPIGVRNRFGSYGRVAWWQLQSRLASGPIARQWLGGSQLIVRSGMHGATGNLYFGLFEFADMAFALHLLRPDDLFVDVGANVGVYTVLASKVCGARTMAFEPAVETLPALYANIEANAIGALVEVHECALGEAATEVRFTKGLDCVNHIMSGDDAASRIVLLRRLDDMLVGEKPVLIKIDVEGFEHGVIAGAAATLAHPRLLAVEIETVEQATLNVLLAAGFAEVFYDPFERALHDAPIGNQAGNRLFVRNREAIGDRLRAAPHRNIHGVTL